jgi:hypothetical protein
MTLVKKGLPSPAARAVASLAAALVLVLTVLAASPELHESLHGRGPCGAGAAHHEGVPPGGQAADDEDGCVVTLFAQGLVLALALAVPRPAGPAPRPANLDPGDRMVPASPRYLRLPSQAPPVGSA